VAETLAALRAAGYAPVGESADGVPEVERVESPRAAGRGQPVPAARPAPPGPAPVDPRALAGRLLAAPVPAPRTRPGPGGRRGPALPGMPDLDELAGFGELADLPALDQPDRAGGDHFGDEEDLAEALADRAGQLPPGERRLLAHAIETDGAVEIGYTNAQGSHTIRVIDSVELDGGHLIAWCHLRDDERIFSLHRIQSVAPAS
jgi:hypothetical protein